MAFVIGTYFNRGIELYFYFIIVKCYLLYKIVY